MSFGDGDHSRKIFTPPFDGTRLQQHMAQQKSKDEAPEAEEDSNCVTSGHAKLLGGDADVASGSSGGGRSARARFVHFVREDPLLALTLLGVAIGLCFGILLSAVLPGSEDTVCICTHGIPRVQPPRLRHISTCILCMSCINVYIYMCIKYLTIDIYA